MAERMVAERMSYGPSAVCRRADGKTVFVEGAVPGDTVSVEVTEEKPSFARGRAVEVLEPSPQRTVPLCTQADVCGGCPWAALSYEAQLEAKRANVVSALVRKTEAESAPALPC